MPSNKWFTEQLERERAISESEVHSLLGERSDLSNNLIIRQLEIERQKFDDSTLTLVPKQINAFGNWRDLLEESATSLAIRSRATRSRRLKARTLIADIFSKLGPEVFLLCALATAITPLAERSDSNLITDLQSWWKNVPHPQGLTQTASAICETNSISILTAQYSHFRNDAEQGSSHSEGVPPSHDSLPSLTQQHRGAEEEPTHAESTSAQDFSQVQVTNEMLRTHESTQQQASQSESALQSDNQVTGGSEPSPSPYIMQLTTVVLNVPSAALSDAATPALPATKPLPSLDLNLTHILGFLGEYKKDCPELQMICPFPGIPLPSIDIELNSSPEFKMKITLSLRSSEALLAYVMAQNKKR